MKRLFLSDFHLQPQQNNSQNLLKQLLQKNKSIFNEVDEIYLLGDIFEYWIDLKIGHNLYPDSLKTLSQLGQKKPIFFMVGNRDFLISSNQLQSLNLIPLPDPYHLLIDNNNTILLTHGDLFIKNLSYKIYYKIIRFKWLQRLFRILPNRTKQNIAHYLRKKSKSSKITINPDISTINKTIEPAKKLYPLLSLDQLLTQQDLLVICGHFHKPAQYKLEDKIIYQLGALEYFEKNPKENGIFVLLMETNNIKHNHFPYCQYHFLEI